MLIDTTYLQRHVYSYFRISRLITITKKKYDNLIIRIRPSIKQQQAPKFIMISNNTIRTVNDMI